MTILIERAFSLAIELHGEQYRKASIVPNAAYMSHLTEVAGMVWGAFANDDPTAETVVAAALLHDAIEDHPSKMPRKRIESRCGRAILDLVEELTEKGTGGAQKAPWQQHKLDYLDHISEMSTSALLISVCDKLQSTRELWRQVRRIGNSAYVPFCNTEELAWQCKERQGWFYNELVNAYRGRLNVICKSLQGPICHAILALVNEFEDIVVDLGFD